MQKVFNASLGTHSHQLFFPRCCCFLSRVSRPPFFFSWNAFFRVARTLSPCVIRCQQLIEKVRDVSFSEAAIYFFLPRLPLFDFCFAFSGRFPEPSATRVLSPPRAPKFFRPAVSLSRVSLTFSTCCSSFWFFLSVAFFFFPSFRFLLIISLALLSAVLLKRFLGF